MTEAHDDPRFRNSATYQVAVTVTIAGGARWQTAHRRADRVAERIANAAARAADVVDVHAQVGPPDAEGRMIAPTPVHFAAANSGTGRLDRPDRLSRYLDADHERALTSLADANRRHRQRRDADRDRRRAVGCVNAVRALWTTTTMPGLCGCVYCDPDLHLVLAEHPDERGGEVPRCLCGRSADSCSRHADAALVVMDGDLRSLAELAELRAAGGPEARP